VDSYGIRAVSLRTGLSQYLLRAWELRYAAVAPQRTATGRRRYTQEQVRRLELLAKARATGHSIGTIASLPLEELTGLAPKTGRAELAIVTNALSALHSLDPIVLDRELEHALKELGRLELVDGFVFPFLSRVRGAVERGMLRPAHLSFAHARVRQLLGLVAAAMPLRADAPQVVMSSAQGLEHEPGLLGSVIHAAAVGWRAIRFSPGTPAEEIAYVATSKNAPAVVYSIVWSAQTTGAVAEATLLRRLVPPTSVVMFGGRLDLASSEALVAAGLERIPDMQGLRDRLSALALQLQHGSTR
jgi:DNA-binding transcriptional MerR regulator